MLRKLLIGITALTTVLSTLCLSFYGNDNKSSDKSEKITSSSESEINTEKNDS